MAFGCCASGLSHEGKVGANHGAGHDVITPTGVQNSAMVTRALEQLGEIVRGLVAQGASREGVVDVRQVLASPIRSVCISGSDSASLAHAERHSRLGQAPSSPRAKRP